jgi:UDPglucose 6-dehydrogenase
VDVDESKIALLDSGHAPFYEPYLDEFLALVGPTGLLDFSTDLHSAVAASDVIFVAVGTPSLPSGEANLAYVEVAARGIGCAMDSSRYRAVVNKSTVPVGSGNLVETLVREGIVESNGQTDSKIQFGVASNPEFLREGSAIADSLFPDRIVSGTADDRARSLLRELYQPIVEQQFQPPPFLTPSPQQRQRVPLVETSLSSAECIKYAANAFLAMKISFANEMAGICERVGADIIQVTRGVGLDARIGSRFLDAGIGWGGSCFAKDVSSLIHTAGEYGYRPQLLEATLEVNRHQRLVVVQKLQEKLFILKGRTVALLGLSFKPGTDDLRDAPSLQIAERLLGMGARINAYDPVAMNPCRQQHPELRIHYCDTAIEAVTGADATILVTEWEEFRSLDLAEVARRAARPIWIDGRNLIQPEKAFAAGLDYCGVGRAAIRQTPVGV